MRFWGAGGQWGGVGWEWERDALQDEFIRNLCRVSYCSEESLYKYLYKYKKNVLFTLTIYNSTQAEGIQKLLP